MRAFLFLLPCLLLAQTDTKPPAGQKAVLTVSAKGVQIYSCQEGKWVLKAPEAKLFDAKGKEIGSHGAGPVWTFRDGRHVKGQMIAKSDAPAAGDIPWLLLKGEGSFEYIRRWATHGGVAPAGGCEAGAVSRVPYTATYRFYSAKR
jgi:hypothetical protein